MGKFGFLKAVSALALVSSLFLFIPQGATAADNEKFNMSYLYFGNSDLYTDIVNKTGNSLDAIAPSYFDLEADGGLHLTTALDTGFIKEMHGRGLQVTPFLSNHWDRQKGVNALANRELLSTQIADAISAYDLDGIDVDIENLTPAERDGYVDFLRLLRQKLPSGKSVSIAVAPNPWNLTTGWNASYDYGALAQYADYLMLMTYDEHYQGGPEGPVASASFVENTVKASIDKVPPEKLVLGIAFYGRLWKQGSTYGGYGISNNTVEELIQKYRGVVTYDNATKSAKAVITVKASDPKPVVLGKQLDAGKYDIWYENEESIKYKLQLVQKYNLKGTGSWSLGQESGSTWDYYRQWLEGVYFSDIEGYWAQQSILDIVDRGWMLGISSSLFQPNGAITRAQAAAVLVRALGLEDAAAPVSGASFNDTADHWARKEIEIAKQYNIVVGMGDGSFLPDRAVTREQMAVMLSRVLKGIGGSAGTKTFADVSPQTAWSYEAIMEMAGSGIISGYTDGLFHPGEKITRAQMAVLMDRSTPWISNDLAVAGLF